jgi:hypothetical protein
MDSDMYSCNQSSESEVQNTVPSLQTAIILKLSLYVVLIPTNLI